MPDSSRQIDCGIPAIILCGGRSRRMGRNKAELPLDGTTVLQKVESAFAEISDGLILVIGQDATVPETSRADRVLRDENLDFGPLEGLRIGLAAASTTAEMAMVATCDAPLVVPQVYQLMQRRLQASPQHEAVMPLVEGRHHPLTAVYRVSALPVISDMVARQQLRVRDLLGQINVLEIAEAELCEIDPQLRTIRNINTREEYQRMLGEL